MILITGADGIVGRALCNSLSSQAIAFLPIVHRRKSHTFKGALEFDLADTIAPISPYLKEITKIVHLAAAVPHSVYYPDNECSANKTRSVDANVRALQEKTGAHVVYMSSCGLYDRRSPDVKRESSPVKITTPYFAAKAHGEALFRAASNTTILRLSAPIGTGLKPNLVLSQFIMAARNNKAIMLWGSGNREQNYIDCEDITSLIIKILSLQQPVPTTINVASPVPTTMSELAETVVSVIGRGSVDVENKPDPLDGETARYSIEVARNLYGWLPIVSLTNAISKVAQEDFFLNL